MSNSNPQRELLHELTEGPYYKKDSPQRMVIAEPGTSGEKLVLEGHVLNREGKPVPGAWIDFWQADGRGEYDNNRYNLRGHQYTDETGSYHLETVVPEMYGNRTTHIHVKLQANPESPIVTTQLFFPGVNRNETDRIFDPALVVDFIESDKGKQARFDFVLNID